MAELPVAAELQAPPAWRAIDLLSDVHLQRESPKTFEAWAAHMRSTDADAVLILGDLFEVWVGDDARGSDFEARCCEVLAEAASRIEVAFMAGNRDFLVGPELIEATGLKALSDPTLLVAFGRRWLLTHGDALCLGDVEYQKFRAQVRNPLWQKGFLSLPLPQRIQVARQVRSASETRQTGLDPSQYADIDCAEALVWLRANRAPVLIHGHTHRPGDEVLADGFMRHVLSDWELDRPKVRGDVLRLSAAGVERRAPARG